MGWIKERILAEQRKHYRVTGGLDWALLAEKKISSQIDWDIKTVRQCMDFQGLKCNNKDCINKFCPLNKIFDLSKTNKKMKIKTKSENAYQKSKEALKRLRIRN